MIYSSLFSALLLATSATATPFVKERRAGPGTTRSVDLTTVVNTKGGFKELVMSDRARVKSFRYRYKNLTDFPQLEDTSVSAENVGPLLLANVDVGNPPTTYKLIVDTGSSNTFVGADTPYKQTSASQSTGQAVSITYGSGSFSGTEFTDTVILGKMSINAQSIGVAEQSTGLKGLADGILGLGPDDLTQGTVDGTDIVPTVTDNLAKQGQIPNALVALSIPPTNSPEGNNPTIDFGQPDSSKYTGDLGFVPITQQSPSNTFWGLDQSITYGSSKIPILQTTAGIVDSGTSLLILASDAYQAYIQATNATFDDATHLLKVDSMDNLESLFFQIGNNVYELTANAQILPRSILGDMGGDPNAIYLIVADMGHPSDGSMDFVNGFTFLQRFYAVFDSDKQQIGFATTQFTDSTSN